MGMNDKLRLHSFLKKTRVEVHYGVDKLPLSNRYKKKSAFAHRVFVPSGPLASSSLYQFAYHRVRLHL